VPRLARLDALGLLQHVMARGIERREIFKDDKDRISFLKRLTVILEETQTQCYAWTLIPNHVHLLVRTGATPLSKVMRRLMTGHAVTFNKRHRRSGHLFQNRYKSVVCERDPYLLELVRYIHLNPIRAGQVKDLKELDRYRWSGHSAILGCHKNPLIPVKLNQSNKPGKKNERDRRDQSDESLAEKTVKDVLLHFGDTLRVARQRYRQFVKDGVDQGQRPELQGGGLIRSQSGNKRSLVEMKKEKHERSDRRILGSGEFVSEVLRESGEDLHKRSLTPPSLEDIAVKVGNYFNLPLAVLGSKSRSRNISKARSVFCLLAAKKAGYTQAEIGDYLNLSRIGARNSILRGERILDMCDAVWGKV